MKEQGKFTVITIVLLSSSGSAAFLSIFFGMRSEMQGHGIEGYLLPFVTAAVIGGGLALLWHLVLMLIPRLVGARKVAGTIFAAALSGATLLASTWLMSIALMGATAERIDLGEHTAQYRKIAVAVYDASLYSVQLTPLLRRMGADFRGLADAELKTGSVSRSSPGPGPMVDTLLSIASTFQRLGDEGDGAREALDAQQKAANDLLGRLDGIVASTAPLPEMQKRYSATVAELQQVFTEMSKQEFVASIKNAGTVVAATPSLQRIKPVVDERTQKLHAEVDRVMKLQERKRPEMVPFVPISPGEAVVVYADRVFGGWAVAGVVDLLPWMLLVLMIITHKVEDETGDEEGEMPRAKLRHAKPDSETSGSAPRPHLVSAPAPATVATVPAE